MANKRKYTEVVGWWIYTIYIPSVAKFYVGVSGAKKCSQRWNKTKYKNTVLEPYLEEWESMTKTVLVDGLTKEEAYQYEDNIIRALQMNNLCINKQRSGLIEVSDRNAYQKEYYENNTEYQEWKKQYLKQWRLENPEYYKQYRLKKKLEKQLN